MPEGVVIMRKHTRTLVMIALIAVLAATSFGQSISVDGEARGLEIDRGLFSIVNYQQLYGWSKTERAIAEFADLRPQDSQMRIEYRFDEVEPENDNDDPSTLNADRFYADNGIVRVPSAIRYMQEVDDLEMEPLVLLGNTAPWLARDGRPTGPPKDIDEWVEFAVNAISHLNEASDTPVKYVEVMNEPNIERFWTGSKAEYYELFNAVADALHDAFPGIQVGGPALSPGGEMDRWMADFIDVCGSRADFISYHSYSQRPEVLIADIRRYAELFRSETGKTGPRVIITESDFRLPPDEKIEYLVKRQRALLENQDVVLGFHHFQLPYYEEGAHVFGLIDEDASITPENYWPFWAMRNIRGHLLDADISPELSRRGIVTVAALDEDSERKTLSLVAYNPGTTPVRDVEIDFRLPDGFGDGRASIVTVGAGGTELVDSVPTPSSGSSRFSATVDLPARQILVVTAVDGEPVQDLFAKIELDRTSVLVGEHFEAVMSITNLTEGHVTGRLILAGQPTDWDVEGMDEDSFRDLAPGERFEHRVRVTAQSPTPFNGSALYTYVIYRKPRTRSIRGGSIPEKFEAVAPMSFDVLPLQLWAAPDNTYDVTATVTNTFTEPISGTASAMLPDGWLSSEVRYDLEVDETTELTVEVTVPAGTNRDDYEAAVTLTYQGMGFHEPFDVFVREFEQRDSVIVDLSEYRDSDLFTTEDAPYDVSNFGGPFSYPVKFFPSNEVVEYLGIQFQFPNTATGHLNGVRAGGDRIPVRRGDYSEMYMLVAATNGDKSVNFTFEYADGSRSSSECTITDWCVNVRHDEIAVAKAPYRHNETGILRDALPRIMYRSLPVDPNKTLVAIHLPPEQDFWIIALSLVDE
jgi:hypothetical protein